MRDYIGNDPAGFVVSLNLHRRHLCESQRGAVAAKLANMTEGGDRKSDHSANLQSGAISQANAVRMLNVSTRGVATARRSCAMAKSRLVKAVESGGGSCVTSPRPLAFMDAIEARHQGWCETHPTP
jgi:hypothetical protein